MPEAAQAFAAAGCGESAAQIYNVGSGSGLSLNDMLVHKNKLLAGAAILGDGLVGLILDVNALVHLEQDQQAGIKPLQPL